MNRSKSHGKETSLNDVESLKYTRWECKYHIVFIPEIPEESIVWCLTPTNGECVEQYEARFGSSSECARQNHLDGSGLDVCAERHDLLRTHDLVHCWSVDHQRVSAVRDRNGCYLWIFPRFSRHGCFTRLVAHSQRAIGSPRPSAGVDGCSTRDSVGVGCGVQPRSGSGCHARDRL